MTRVVSAVEAGLSRRARVAMGSAHIDAGRASAPLSPAAPLLDSLRHHLLAGETHYPDRPGMVELRRCVGAALPAAGYSERGPDGVLITAGEGESLFVTLLGLGVEAEVTFVAGGAGRHQRLFDWMRVRAVDPGVGAGIGAQVHAIGNRLFDQAATSEGLPAPAAPADTVVIGSLDSLAGMRPFRLGFVAAPPEVLAGITKWKQASSICSPAPSQRAALWALGARP